MRGVILTASLFVRSTQAEHLVVEVEYRSSTSEGLVRHASFQGIREDKDPLDVVREDRRPPP
jgi:bifunctional non-homologous end joining protein LigD